MNRTLAFLTHLTVCGINNFPSCVHEKVTVTCRSKVPVPATSTLSLPRLVELPTILRLPGFSLSVGVNLHSYKVLLSLPLQVNPVPAQIKFASAKYTPGVPVFLIPSPLRCDLEQQRVDAPILRRLRPLHINDGTDSMEFLTLTLTMGVCLLDFLRFFPPHPHEHDKLMHLPLLIALWCIVCRQLDKRHGQTRSIIGQ